VSRVTGFSPAVHDQIRARGNGGEYEDHERCEGCGQWFPRAEKLVEHHHRRPRGSGGSKRVETNLASNALALCGLLCHPWAETERVAAGEKGWLIPQHPKDVAPSSVPVELWDGIFTLDDFGGRVPAEQEKTA
jgi:hypothetical protein